MSPELNRKNLLLVIGRILFLVILFSVILFSGRWNGFLDLYGLAFVILGGIALILTSYTFKEIYATLLNSTRFTEPYSKPHLSMLLWESGARSFWMAGVLATLLSFVTALTGSEGGLQDIATRMASALIPTVYGAILSIICFVPALKLKEMAPPLPPAERVTVDESMPNWITASFGFENLVGYVLILAMIMATLFKVAHATTANAIAGWGWLIYWPAILVVLGGTLALSLFAGNLAKGRIFSLGFALTGLLGLLLGIIQVLLGLSSRSIQVITAAIAFNLSTCFVSLLGMMLVGAPLEDWSLKNRKAGEHSTTSRIAWFGFPLITLILVIITFIIVITPMTK